jgi:hypothetical protein
LLPEQPDAQQGPEEQLDAGSRQLGFGDPTDQADFRNSTYQNQWERYPKKEHTSLPKQLRFIILAIGRLDLFFDS